MVARSLSARIVGEDPSSEPLPDVSGLLGLSFLHSILALQVSRWREALLSLGKSLHRVVQVHLGVFISTTLLRSPSACVIRAHLPNNIKSDQALNKKEENSIYKKKTKTNLLKPLQLEPSPSCTSARTVSMVKTARDASSASGVELLAGRNSLSSQCSGGCESSEDPEDEELRRHSQLELYEVITSGFLLAALAFIASRAASRPTLITLAMAPFFIPSSTGFFST